MTIQKLINAIGCIDDDLVSGAIEYQRKPLLIRLLQRPFLKACACIVIIALVYGFFSLYGQKVDVADSPFVLTAYAVSSENGLTITNAMEKNMKVPISIFETENGLVGFVVSYNKPDASMPSSIAIVSAGNNNDSVEEIIGIANDSTQNYFFYIPAEDAVEPYILPLFISDIESNLVYQYKITIMRDNDNYFAELVEEKIIERVTK